MSVDQGRRTRRDAAKARIAEIHEHEQRALIVHYSCESFDNRPDGTTARITSLAVRNLATGQTSSFSIQLCAERKHLPTAEIPSHYDGLERQMLDEFYDFVRKHPGDMWIGWVMRDTKYGFPHIEHRYQVLGGAPVDIDDAKKINLAGLLVDLYGPSYVEHPRLINLMRLNGISELSFLSGADEPKAFAAAEYTKLHQSTLRKVDNMAYIYERVLQDRLKTDARFCAVDDALLAELPVRYWHCAMWDTKDESAIDNDLTLDDVERKIVVPWRDGKSFVVGGKVFQSRDQIARVFITRTNEPLAHFKTIDAKASAERRARDEASGVLIAGMPGPDSRFSALHAGDDHVSRLLFESFDLSGANRGVSMPNVSSDVVNKTASILFLDIVGWSKLSAADIRAFVEKALPKLGDIVKKRNPWMVNTWGDAIVAVFDSATACAETALDLCDFFGRAKASDGVAQGMSARVGAHIGEVFKSANPITSKPDIFGPAVHTAARLEPVAAAGHAFCTSDFANRLVEVQGEAPRAYPIGELELAKGFGRQQIFVLAWPNAPAPHIGHFQETDKTATSSAAQSKVADWLKQCKRPFTALYKLIDGSSNEGSINSSIGYFSNFGEGGSLEVHKLWQREVASRLRELERWGVGIQAALERESPLHDLLVADLGRWLNEFARAFDDVAGFLKQATDARGATNANARRHLADAREEIVKQFEKISDSHNVASDASAVVPALSIPKLVRLD